MTAPFRSAKTSAQSKAITAKGSGPAQNSGCHPCPSPGHPDDFCDNQNGTVVVSGSPTPTQARIPITLTWRLRYIYPSGCCERGFVCISRRGTAYTCPLGKDAEASIGTASISLRKENEVAADYQGIKQKKVVTGWNILPDRDSTVTVQWYMDFTLRWYPWEKFSSILFEKQYGPQMEQGLARLKNLLERSGKTVAVLDGVTLISLCIL